MDYTTWPEFQANQTPTPLSSYPQPSIGSYPLPLPQSYSAHYLSYPQNPNLSSFVPQSSIGTHELQSGAALEPVVNPPGVDSYAPLTSNSITHLGHEGVPNFSYGHTQVVDSSSLVASSGYCLEPNAQNWTAREAVRQYGADPVSYGAGIAMPATGSEQLTIANPNSTWWTNTTAQPHGNEKWKKHQKKPKTKIVQSAYCEVCKIDCTSKDVLDQHKLGKKHKKNVEKLRQSLRPPQVRPSVSSSNPVIGPQLPPEKSKSVSGSKSKRKTAETPEDLEKKKKKVLEGGAAAEAVRICGICNVVCNSETVYKYHLAGQKHAAILKKASEHRQPNAS